MCSARGDAKICIARRVRNTFVLNNQEDSGQNLFVLTQLMLMPR